MVRRFLLKLVVLLLATSASAQFTSSSVPLSYKTTPRPLRLEAISDVAGDITIQAAQAGASLTTGPQGASVTVSVFFNVPLSNRAQASSSPLVNSNGTVPSTGVQVSLSNFTFASGTTTISWSNATTNSVDIVIQLGGIL